ncbi:MAG: universal stress protein [Desulfobacterales bacterium]
METVIGFPHREILRIARDETPDIIVMGGSTGASGAYAYKKNITGSTFQRVAKAARCPVMVINRPAASFWGGISNVLFATDFSAAADRAFDFAFALVQELGCDFTCFMHWMSPGMRRAISIPRTLLTTGSGKPFSGSGCGMFPK